MKPRARSPQAPVVLLREAAAGHLATQLPLKSSRVVLVHTGVGDEAGSAHARVGSRAAKCAGAGGMQGHLPWGLAFEP